MDEQNDEVAAAEWRRLRLALSERFQDLLAARNAARDDAERAQLQKRIEEIKQQVHVLAVEELVAQFVEDAERYVIAQSAFNEELRRDPDSEIA